MSEKKTTEPWFWLVAIVAVVWNLMGVGAYLMQVNMGPEDLANLPEAQRALYENVPAWATGAFAIAVFAGAIAAILLILRKKAAFLVFVLSLVAVLVQMVYVFFMSGALDVQGLRGAIMPFMVILLAVFFVWFSKVTNNKGITA